MANGNDNLKTFTPSVDEGLLDVSPSLTLDAFSAVVNPFSIENPLRTGAREEKIREELKSTHIPEFADFLLKGGVRGVGSENLDKTYAKTDNPLIKQAILRGDDFLTNSIIRNNFYGLNLDDRNLIAQAYVINARFSPFSSLGKSKEGETPKEVIAEFDKIKKDREDFNEGKITQAEYDVAKGKFYRNLTEDLSKGASRTLLGDPAFKSLPPIADPYTGKPASREAAMAAGLGPFSRGFTDIRVTDVPLLEELQLKSKYGLSPEVPDFLGPRVGVKYIPARDQERFKVIPQRSEEGREGFRPERTIDRLEDYIPITDFPGAAKTFIDPTFLAGPEGNYYNPKTKEFLRTEDVYGTPPTLQGYQYDPRLIELLKMQRGEDFAQQFRKTGGLMQLAQGRDTMDIKQQTKNVAAQGRFGDSMLLHVNPAEVKGLAQAMPITVNPQTGQPEAFLPFLAPLLGSTLFSSLAATGALGATLASNAALASGIGAGLATYAQTGGSGSKALLSGLTAGFGTSAAGKAAAGVDPSVTSTVSQSVRDTVTTDLLQNPNFVESVAGTGQLAGTTLNEAGQQALQAELTKAVPFTDSVKTMFTSPQGTFSFDQGAKAAFDAVTSPSGIAATTAAGTGAIMQSRDDFEASLLANEEERKRRRQAILDANPENIPLVFAKSGESSSDFPDLTGDGKVTQADILKGRGVKLNRGQSIRRQVEAQIADDAERIAMMNQPNPYLEEGSSPVPIARREATNIPTGFMAGFQPEMQYFKNLNPTATEITEGQSAPTGGTMPIPPRSFPRPFDPTETAAYRNFYGQGADLSIPMQVDPYSPVTYQEKPRFVAQPTLPIIRPEPDLIPIVGGIDALPITGEGGGLGALFDNLPKTGTPSVGKGAAIAETPDISEEQIQSFVSENLPEDTSFTPVDVEQVLVEALSAPSDVTVPPSSISRIPSIATTPVSRKSELEMYEDTLNEMPLLRQAGGITDIDMQDPLVQKTIKFILGELDSDTIVQQFIDKYSPEDYRNLRRAVLTTVVPDAQTEGMIKGVNNGGMKDDIGGMIGSSQPVAVSQDEYIIPADAVAMLGDGSSDSGAKKLDAMLDRIRMDKTGTTRQAKEIDNRVLPA